MIKSTKGFNLVELIVAISIFGILATIVTVNLRGGSAGREASLHAGNMASLLREAQLKALGGEPFQGSVPTGGYGVSVATCSAPPCVITLFADVNGNFALDGGEEVSSINLGNTGIITSVSISDPLAVTFKPPKPIICYGTTCSGAGVATITVGILGEPVSSQVIIDQNSGRISAD